jgi:hypothetical protein
VKKDRIDERLTRRRYCYRSNFGSRQSNRSADINGDQSHRGVTSECGYVRGGQNKQCDLEFPHFF